MLRLLSILLVVLLVGCAGSPAQTPAATPNPLDLIQEAAANIRSADTFRISVDQTGPDYMIHTDYATVFFRSANAQYVAPGTMQATIRVIALGLPIEFEVFSRGRGSMVSRASGRAISGSTSRSRPTSTPKSLIAEDTRLSGGASKR